MGKKGRKKSTPHKRKIPARRAVGVRKGAHASSTIPPRFSYLAAPVLIALTVLIVYSNTFNSPFQFDDTPNIVDNLTLGDLSNFWPPLGSRYIAFLSFALNYHLGGPDPFGFHLVNTMIHIINGILVWWLVLLTFKTPAMESTGMKPGLKPGLGFFIAVTSSLIFICHPVQTQAVTYITQRFASLAALFYLLSLALYVKWRISRTMTGKGGLAALYVTSLIAAVLAMKTKEISFTLPIVILLYEYLFFTKGDRGWKKLLPTTPFLLTLPVIPLSLYSTLGGGSATYIAEVIRRAQVEELVTLSTHDYIITQLRVIVTYLRLLVMPINQNVDYDYPVYTSFIQAEVLSSLIFLIIIIGLAVYLYTRSRKTGNRHALLVSFGIFWFFTTLSVESSVIPIKDVIFEHRLYLPLVGASLAFCSAAFYFLDKAGRNISVLTAACVLVAFTAAPLGVAAFNRNKVWVDEVTFWEDIVKKSPQKARDHNNLGSAYYTKGRVDDALKRFRAAIKLKPELPDSYNNLGYVYFNRAHVDEAIEEYKKALRLKPEFLKARSNLALAYFRKGLAAEAIDEYKLVLSTAPDYADAHYNLGLVYYSLGRKDEARDEYIQAIKYKPDFAKAHYYLALVYHTRGLADEAVVGYKKAISINPDYAKAHNNLGALYYEKGLGKEAVEEYKKALKLEPGYSDAHNNLGIAYFKGGRTDDAIEEFESAVRSDPGNASARYNLGKAYLEKGLKNEAKKELEETLKISPDYEKARKALKSL